MTNHLTQPVNQKRMIILVLLLLTHVTFIFQSYGAPAPNSTRVTIEGGFIIIDVADPKDILANAYFAVWMQQAGKKLQTGVDSYKKYPGGDNAGIRKVAITSKGRIVTIIVDGTAYNAPDTGRERMHNNQWIYYGQGIVASAAVGVGTVFFTKNIPATAMTTLGTLAISISLADSMVNSNFESMDDFDIAFQWILAFEYLYATSVNSRGQPTSEVRETRNDLIWKKRFRTDYPKKYKVERHVKID